MAFNKCFYSQHFSHNKIYKLAIMNYDRKNKKTTSDFYLQIFTILLQNKNTKLYAIRVMQVSVNYIKNKK